jgi:hypothetical protein
MSKDSLHPTVKGYQVWADGLKPIFTELLGRQPRPTMRPRPLVIRASMPVQVRHPPTIERERS